MYSLEPTIYVLSKIKKEKKDQKFSTKTLRYDNTPMQYAVIFHGCKNDYFQMKICDMFLIFAQNIDLGYTLDRLTEAVLTSTLDLCFRAKIRKMYTPGNPNFTI